MTSYLMELPSYDEGRVTNWPKLRDVIYGQDQIISRMQYDTFFIGIGMF